MFRSCLALALTLTLGLFPAVARATIVTGGFSGVLSGNLQDSYGLFGAAGADLSGAYLTARYSYDTAAAFSYLRQPTADAYLGTGNLTLSVTIDGATVAAAATADSQIIATADGARSAVVLATLAPTPLVEFRLAALGAWLPGVTLDAPFVLDPRDYGQTIYASADGSHYDVLTFHAEAVPAPGGMALFVAALAVLGRLRLGCRDRRLGSHD